MQTKICSTGKRVLGTCASQPCMTHARICQGPRISRTSDNCKTNSRSRPDLQTCRVFDQFKNWLTPQNGGAPSQPSSNQQDETNAEDEEELFEFNDEGGTMVRIGGDEENTGLGRSEAFGPLVSYAQLHTLTSLASPPVCECLDHGGT